MGLVIREFLLCTLIVCSITSSYAQSFCKIEKDYAVFCNYEKAQGVHFKIRIPRGWTIKEGNRPHIVAKLTPDNSLSSVVVFIDKGETFISRNQAIEIYDSGELERVLLEEFTFRQTPIEIVSAENVFIDSYPTRFIISTYTQRLPGQLDSLDVLNLQWTIFYEDYVISLNAYIIDELGKDFLQEYYDSISIPYSLVLFDHYNL